MHRRHRLIFLGISLIVLIGVGFYAKGNFEFLLNDFWFTSGFLLLILLSLIDQPHFSTDANVFINAVAGGISLLLVEQEFRTPIFWFFLSGVGYLAISSYLLMWNRSQSLPMENKLIQFVSRINRLIGKPQALFSAFFLWGALIQFGMSTKGFNALLLYWVIFMILNVPAIASTINQLFDKNTEFNAENAIGKIFSVQSGNIYLAKLFKDQKVTPFSFVEFKHNNKIQFGLVVDHTILEEEQWIKFLSSDEINKCFNKDVLKFKFVNGVVYKNKEQPGSDITEKLVGVVSENSNIGSLKFTYNSKIPVQEGQLLEVNINNCLVYYQIIEGTTRIESLEEKNQSSFITGEAIQLGSWNHESTSFDKFGWVPVNNSAVKLASEIEEVQVEDGELKIGHIPNSNFPVILSKELALTHHTAVLGVTGTGKSVFSRILIREYLKDEDVKVICIDFTGEYAHSFTDLNPHELISESDTQKLYKRFEWVSNELEKFGNQQDKDKLKRADQEIREIIEQGLESFLKSQNSSICVFELPEVSNSSSVLEYTRQIFKSLFKIAKTDGCFGNKVCMVLEEAHTIIPEWKFVGVADKSSSSLLNSIAQIALQGRKYNIGLLVIAQRTANVSKTILTQCNTIISFQGFDKTSKEFLANYFGEGIANTLPNLKFRQAIAAGKALKSNVPMIFEVPEIDESKYSNTEDDD